MWHKKVNYDKMFLQKWREYSLDFWKDVHLPLFFILLLSYPSEFEELWWDKKSQKL